MKEPLYVGASGRLGCQPDKHGWMYTLKTDALFYHFLEEDELYLIPFDRLRKWAFHERKIFDYDEKQQSKYEQMNDTWGRCVPVQTLFLQLNLRPPFKPMEELAAYDPQDAAWAVAQ